MEIARLPVFCVLFLLVSAKLGVKEEFYTAFFGEDVHLSVPSLKTTEVLFKPTAGPKGTEIIFMRDGEVVSTRAHLNLQQSHLVLEDVGEEDEGVYVIKHSDNPRDVKHINLIVKDCTIEHNLQYGDTYHISLSQIMGPITLEFRPSALLLNQTADTVVLLLNQSWTPAEEYQGRLMATEKKVSLHTVTGSDEGSYTILDSTGKVKKRTCLNVKEYHKFEELSYGSTLKINLIVDSSKVTVQYKQKSTGRARLIIDQGELVEPLDPSLGKRFSVDGTMCTLEGVRFSDSGWFQVTDLQGFIISEIELEVEAYRLPPLYVAIISLLSLLVFLLCLCLLSCLVKVHRRAVRARTLARIARDAGKGDGEAFRQVVHEAYTRFTEESVRSQWDSKTDSTEVEIKGLEVSKGGRYHALPSDKNFLDMSDSGVEFNISGLPLDSDTDMPPSYPSLKPLLDSDHLNGSATQETDLNAKQTPDSLPSGSPALEPRVGSSPKAKHDIIAPPPESGPVEEVERDSAPPAEGVADQCSNEEKAAV